MGFITCLASLGTGLATDTSRKLVLLVLDQDSSSWFLAPFSTTQLRLCSLGRNAQR